jgi:uncharacterized protein (TIGR02118 family)
MPKMILTVLYPPPTNPDQFEQDYQQHLSLLHEQLAMPVDHQPYQVNRMLDGPTGPATFYLQFSMPFDNAEQLKRVLNAPGMQVVASDANRISTGGAPVVMIGEVFEVAIEQKGSDD